MTKHLSALGAARTAWRKLPLGLRSRAGVIARTAVAPSLARSLPRAAPELRRPAEAVSILGLPSSALGVGAGARLLALELQAASIGLGMLDAAPLVAAPQDGNADADLDDPSRPLIVALNPDVAVHALSARRPALGDSRRVIGFWVWELDRLPPSWRVGAGWVHEIWTPSRFSAAAFGDFGVPVVVTPHPAALAPPPVDAARRDPVRTQLGIGPDDFLALSSFALSSSLERKNPLGAIAAFRKAFRARTGARLVLRCLGGDRHPGALSRLRAAARDAGGSVILIDKPGPVAELWDLYAAADAYISLHRAEGFGLNLAEAMLAGLPVIATAYSANLEFMHESCARLIPASLAAPRDRWGPYGLPDALWAEPDLDAAVSALRALAADPQHRAEIGAAARRRAAQMTGGAAARALRMDRPT